MKSLSTFSVLAQERAMLRGTAACAFLASHSREWVGHGQTVAINPGRDDTHDAVGLYAINRKHPGRKPQVAGVST